MDYIKFIVALAISTTCSLFIVGIVATILFKLLFKRVDNHEYERQLSDYLNNQKTREIKNKRRNSIAPLRAEPIRSIS